MSEYKKYHCMECEHIYDEAKGDPDSGIAPGTRWGYSGRLGVSHLRRAQKFL